MSEENKTTEAESAAPEGSSRRKFLKGGLAAWRRAGGDISQRTGGSS